MEENGDGILKPGRELREIADGNMLAQLYGGCGALPGIVCWSPCAVAGGKTRE